MLDLSAGLLDFERAPIVERMSEAGPVPLTAAKACLSALLNALPGDERAPVTEKVQRFVLAQRIAANPKLELSAEDISLLKRLVGLGYPPLVVGRVYEILDPASVK